MTILFILVGIEILILIGFCIDNNFRPYRYDWSWLSLKTRKAQKK